MGRGRQKAKQTKVARELKYHSSSIDVTALQRELGGGHGYQPPPPQASTDEEDEYDDPYASYVDDDEDDEGSQGQYASAR